MASKTDFTPDEWTLILQSPMIVGNRNFGLRSFGAHWRDAGGHGQCLGIDEGKVRSSADALIKRSRGISDVRRRTNARNGLKATISGGAPGEIKSKDNSIA